MPFVLEERAQNKTDQELSDDVAKVASDLGLETLTIDEYEMNGKFASDTLRKRFGNWGNVLIKAGLIKAYHYQTTLEDLYKNIEEVWIDLGRQPRIEEMTNPLSRFSGKTYQKRFGSWTKALQSFIEYINTDLYENQKLESNTIISNNAEHSLFVHRTARNPSGKLKVQVLARDGNICRLCGEVLVGTSNIHFDHIKPWSKGGETTLDNLQILCAQHNLEKGNLDYT